MLIFEGGVFVKTKLSKSNEAVGRSEFPRLVLKVAVFALAAVLTICSTGTAAQSIFGRISGTVTDAQGGSVAGLKITIVNEETKLESHTTTDSNGDSEATDLPLRGYRQINEQ